MMAFAACRFDSRFLISETVIFRVFAFGGVDFALERGRFFPCRAARKFCLKPRVFIVRGGRNRRKIFTGRINVGIGFAGRIRADFNRRVLPNSFGLFRTAATPRLLPDERAGNGQQKQGERDSAD
jgi:hypothetical protein